MTDPQLYLKNCAQTVNAALEHILPSDSTRPQRLHQAMRHSVFSGGKRLRPALCIAACEACCGGTAEQALDAACALELLHTSTLIHDDLPAMDDDTLRRGCPTCHIQFDEAVAILAGDALLALAFEVLAPLPNGALLVKELSHCFAQIANGQTEDLQAEGKTPDADLVEYIHMNKTAALIRTSCIMGGICAGADSQTLKKLAQYGESTGLAFQLIDDLLDESSTEEELGKNIGSDREKGKMTWPTVHGVEATKQRADELTATAAQTAKSLPNGETLIALTQLMASRRS
jgi:geranylgeranyl diphosphate synthase type II